MISLINKSPYADEHSIVYGRLKTRLQLDIVKFCLNEVDLKDDFNVL